MSNTLSHNVLSDKISLTDISFSYNNKDTVFNNYCASFEAGRLTAIMSPSGSGKTTLLYIIAGLLEADKGTVTYPVENPRFSMVFQDCRLIEHVSVGDNIKLVNPSISDEAIAECLRRLMLDGFIHKRVKQLSGGEKQRAAIARAILAPYDILLMDEPFTGLDDEVKDIVIKYIKSRTAGRTVLLVTHDKSEVMALDCPVINL